MSNRGSRNPKKKSGGRRNAPQAKKSAADMPPLPDRRALESVIAGFAPALGGPRKRSSVDEAQEIMYQTWDAGSKTQSVTLAKKALSVSADCADAYVLLAEAAATSLAETTALYQKGVEAGERALGKRTFKEDVGYFWGLLETRPYMRARAGLAQCMWMSGKRDEAIAHYKELLRLNPNDNQGLRYVLAACLLDMQRDGELTPLIEQYENDASAAWAYTKALLQYRRANDTEESRAALAEALESNPFVPAYLLGKKRLPRELPEYIGFGDENEAISYAVDFGSGWKDTEGSLRWLAKNAKR